MYRTGAPERAAAPAAKGFSDWRAPGPPGTWLECIARSRPACANTREHENRRPAPAAIQHQQCVPYIHCGQGGSGHITWPAVQRTTGRQRESTSAVPRTRLTGPSGLRARRQSPL